MALLIFSFFLKINLFAQHDIGFAQINLHPEIKKIIAEIEGKTRKTIEVNVGEFEKDNQTTFGTSFINDAGRAVVNIRHDLLSQPKKVEAVVTHELLHLKLRVNGFPVFLWSPTVKTSKGRAIDVEQSNVNDLLSLIEHQVFKSEMIKYDLFKAINLAGDTLRLARLNRNKPDGQPDSLNYARALLEYHEQNDIDEVKKIYTANKWNISLNKGKQIAEVIQTSNPQTPGDVEKVFLRCLLILYPTGANYTFKLVTDPNSKFEKLMIINTAKKR